MLILHILSNICATACSSCTPNFGTESASSQAWRELAGSLCAVASVSPGESSRHRSNHHPHHHDYQSSGDEAIDDAEEDYIAAAEAAIAALGSRVDSRCRSFRDCKPLLIHNSSGTATREFRRAPVQVNSWPKVSAPLDFISRKLSISPRKFLQLHIFLYTCKFPLSETKQKSREKKFI